MTDAAKRTNTGVASDVRAREKGFVVPEGKPGTPKDTAGKSQATVRPSPAAQELNCGPVLILCCVALLLTGCDPYYDPTVREERWLLKRDCDNLDATPNYELGICESND